MLERAPPPHPCDSIEAHRIKFLTNQLRILLIILKCSGLNKYRDGEGGKFLKVVLSLENKNKSLKINHLLLEFGAVKPSLNFGNQEEIENV